MGAGGVPHYMLSELSKSLPLSLHGEALSIGGDVLIDAHNSPVVEGVRSLYEKVLKRTGKVATLIEWDDGLPSFEVLNQEAIKARGYFPAI